MTTAWLWLPHPEKVWCPGQLVQNTLEATGRDGERWKVPETTEAIEAVQPDQEQGVEDVCSLAFVSEASLLNTILVRYLADNIYTRIAGAIIAVNPFAQLPIYSTQHVDRYMAAVDCTELPPHIYSVGRAALVAIQERRGNQAVITSGESGAGKTESTKLILSFVAEGSRRRSGVDGAAGLEERVLQTSRILEAFGNSMTVRNHNSSRFGKWLDLQFAHNSVLTGCVVTTYLLETTRVCAQARNERGFHVFFQLLAAAGKNSSILGECQTLLDPGAYRYLKGGQLTIPGVNDAEQFEELVNSLEALGFVEDRRTELFNSLAGILTLGNCEIISGYIDADVSLMAQDAPIKEAAHFLGVGVEALERCLLFKTRKMGKDLTRSPVRAAQAQAGRDGLARALFGSLFLALIEHMNAMLRGGDTLAAHSSIGILDIAGFENFAKNSLEQLMINLGNENLQQHFNRVVIKEDLEMSAAEGVPVPDIGKYEDNADCLVLLDGRGGILDLLEESMSIPKAADSTFVASVLKSHGKHPRLVCQKILQLGFVVRHFAGEVAYSCDGWLERNAGAAPDEAAGLLASSRHRLLQEIGKRMEGAQVEPENMRGRANRNVRSVTGAFRVSLKSLMEKVSSSECHYVRCIKPNSERRARTFEAKMVMEQLLLSGLLATVRIRQQGYAHRLTHSEFVDRYRVLAASADRPLEFSTSPSTRSQALAIIEVLPKAIASISELAARYPGDDCVFVGKTKVLMSSKAFTAMDKARDFVLRSVLIKISKTLRGCVVRRRVQAVRELVGQIASVMGTKKPSLPSLGTRRLSFWEEKALLETYDPDSLRGLIERLEPLLDQVDRLTFQNKTVTDARRIVLRGSRELHALKEVKDLMRSSDPVLVQKGIAHAQSLRLPPSSGLDALKCRLQLIETQLPLFRMMQSALAVGNDAQDSEHLQQLQLIVEAAAELGLSNDSPIWLAELGGHQLYKTVLDAISALQAKAKAAELADKTGEIFDEPSPPEGVGASVSRVASDIDFEKKTRIKESLTNAIRLFDAELLEQLLRDAAQEATLDKTSEVAILPCARELFANLQDEQFVLATLRNVREQADCERPSFVVLQQMEHLVIQLLKLEPGPEDVEEITHARRFLQQTWACRSSDGPRTEFMNLQNFSRLKPRSTHGPDPRRNAQLSLPLTCTPDDCDKIAYEAAARQNFRNVLICMGDWPAPEIERSASQVAIVEMAMSDPRRCEEVYLQVLQQLTNAQSRRSLQLGWVLLRHLCANAFPPTEFAAFLRAYILQNWPAPEVAQNSGFAWACIEAFVQSSQDLSKEEANEQQCVGARRSRRPEAAADISSRAVPQQVPSFAETNYPEDSCEALEGGKGKGKLKAGKNMEKRVEPTSSLATDCPAAASAAPPADSVARKEDRGEPVVVVKGKGKVNPSKDANMRNDRTPSMVADTLPGTSAGIRESPGVPVPEESETCRVPVSGKGKAKMSPTKGTGKGTEPTASKAAGIQDGGIPDLDAPPLATGRERPIAEGSDLCDLAEVGEGKGKVGPNKGADIRKDRTPSMAADTLPGKSAGITASPAVPGAEESETCRGAVSGKGKAKMSPTKGTGKGTEPTPSKAAGIQDGGVPDLDAPTLAAGRETPIAEGSDLCDLAGVGKGKGKASPSKGADMRNDRNTSMVADTLPGTSAGITASPGVPAAEDSETCGGAVCGKGKAKTNLSKSQGKGSEPTLSKAAGILGGGITLLDAPPRATGPETPIAEGSDLCDLAEVGKGKGKVSPRKRIDLGNDLTPSMAVDTLLGISPGVPVAEEHEACRVALSREGNAKVSPSEGAGKGTDPTPSMASGIQDGGVPDADVPPQLQVEEVSDVCKSAVFHEGKCQGKATESATLNCEKSLDVTILGFVTGLDTPVAEGRDLCDLAEVSKNMGRVSLSEGFCKGCEQTPLLAAGEAEGIIPGVAASPRAPGVPAIEENYVCETAELGTESPNNDIGRGSGSTISRAPSTAGGVVPASAVEPPKSPCQDASGRSEAVGKGKGKGSPIKGPGKGVGPTSLVAQSPSDGIIVVASLEVSLAESKGQEDACQPSAGVNGKGKMCLTESTGVATSVAENTMSEGTSHAPSETAPRAVAALAAQGKGCDGPNMLLPGGKPSVDRTAATATTLTVNSPIVSEGTTLAVNSPRGTVHSPSALLNSSRGAPLNSPRFQEASLVVLGYGDLGLEEVRERLADSMVAWILLRFGVGGGDFVRTKFFIVHFNGDAVSAVLRGRLNARKREAVNLLGDAHATLEVNRTADLTVEHICKRVLPMMTSDDMKGSSGSSLAADYEKLVSQAKAASRSKQRASSLIAAPRTAKERGLAIDGQKVLRAVGNAGGAFNWMLLEPEKLDLHNAGYGGLDEMLKFLNEDKVLFGLIRFTFGGNTEGVPRVVKYVFVHWIGPSTGFMKRGKWNANMGAAEKFVRSVCAPAMKREVVSMERLQLAEIIQELRRLTVIDGSGASEELFSVEGYMAALEAEKQQLFEAELVEAEADTAPLLSVEEAVRDVRNDSQLTNWVLIGFSQGVNVRS